MELNPSSDANRKFKWSRNSLPLSGTWNLITIFTRSGPCSEPDECITHLPNPVSLKSILKLKIRGTLLEDLHVFLCMNMIGCKTLRVESTASPTIVWNSFMLISPQAARNQTPHWHNGYLPHTKEI
ncbi:hypothetical protein L798_10758 [Zootermopsis nevadensis]|uniref:Uncharacterized protein n=1 Tax=Zootermopsis nevadensis TaxID=136037 RepID=A0A067R8A4_ZOONE|nr:hypothetical protein L798_10758 [Zootermopsis nevadensis]